MSNLNDTSHSMPFLKRQIWALKGPNFVVKPKSVMSDAVHSMYVYNAKVKSCLGALKIIVQPCTTKSVCKSQHKTVINQLELPNASMYMCLGTGLQLLKASVMTCYHVVASMR